MSSPQNSRVRPTTDKLRAALFSILGGTVESASVLDAFAGTGAFGIEAFSRGAAHVSFVDTDTAALKPNLALMDKNACSVRKANFLTVAKMMNEKFDIIFLDPPYSLFKPEDVLNEISSAGLLRDGGIIIYEEFYKTAFPNAAAFELFDERRYGDTTVRFYR